MAVQPLLTKTVSPVGEIHYHIIHENRAYDVSNDSYEPSHIHSYYEIYVNLSGDVAFLHDRQIYAVQSGDVIISRPGDMHYCIYRSTCQHEYYCLWFEESGSSDTLKDFMKKDTFRGAVRLADSDRAELFRLLKAMENAKRDGGIINTLQFLQLLALLSGQSEPITKMAPSFSRRMDTVLMYIDAHLAEIRCSKEIADAAFISEATLNRLFREELHISVHRFIEAKRLLRAEILLKNGYSVTDACFSVGFSDCSRFIARFKEKFGTTPHKYKHR